MKQILILIVISVVAPYVGAAKNVVGGDLKVCSTDPMTGWRRSGKCTTDKDDYGTHVVCAKMTEDFLEYTKSKGNDLSTPTSYFPGLKPGDKWCLCALRWRQGMNGGHAPHVDLDATYESATKYVSLDDLKKYKLDK